MATIDLGKIKLVNKNTWDTNTTYTADDIVQYTDNGILSTYICVVTSSQGHTPSSSGTTHSSWNFLAKGIADPVPTQNSGTNGKFLTSNGSAASWGTVTSSILQAKQWVKHSVIYNESTSDSVMASPFDGGATITPAAASNIIKVSFFSTIDHGSTWRSGKYRLEWSSDGGSNYVGLAGMAVTVGGQGDNMYGNNGSITVMFHPNTTNAVKVRVVYNGHNAGQGKRHGQYNNEGADGSTVSLDVVNGVPATGMAILLEEYSSAVASITTIS